MTDNESVEPKKSVAPLGSEMQKCPLCHAYTAYTDRTGGVLVNKCSRVLCTYWERVTEDHVPKLFTEAGIRVIAREEAIRVSREYRAGEPVMGSGAISAGCKPPGPIMPERFGGG